MKKEKDDSDYSLLIDIKECAKKLGIVPATYYKNYLSLEDHPPVRFTNPIKFGRKEWLTWVCTRKATVNNYAKKKGSHKNSPVNKAINK